MKSLLRNHTLRQLRNLVHPSQTRTFHLTCCTNFQVVAPGKVSPLRIVPDSIFRPPYITQSWLESLKPGIRSPEKKTPKQIQGMRDACALAREILLSAGWYAKVGMTTDEIDDFVHELTVQSNAYPSPLLYKGFPKSVCTSVNNVACHGVPDDRFLLDGDIINIDVTVYYNGFHGDTSATFMIGEVDAEGGVLVDIAEECRDTAIQKCGPGQPFSIIGKTVSEVAESLKYKVIGDFCGHGIGEYFHGPPDIIHVGNDVEGIMEEGMTFTIEPVITEGEPTIKILDDGWTAVSLDNSRSAQFEHTILITEHGVDILTA